MKTIKALIPESLKLQIRLLVTTSHDPYWLKYASFQNRRIFIFLAGFYPNMGDMAITHAQKCFLQKIFPDAEVICVPSNQTYRGIKTIRRYIRPDDLITIAGGGNIDDLYPSLERAREFVVRSFPNNRIVSFPQSVHFSESLEGRRIYKRSRKVYENHPNLTFFAREKESLKRFRRLYPKVDTKICPDIVLSLKLDMPYSERVNVLWCLRKDMEQLIETKTREKLFKEVKRAFGDVIIMDTTDVSPERCTEEMYEATLMEFWQQLRTCRIVLTDRLHCMIFCVITGTPCVVLDNTNHKINSVYNSWLKECSYIKMLNNFKLESIIDAMERMTCVTYPEIFKIDVREFELLQQACVQV